MGFHFPKGGSGASSNLQEALEALVAEITLMRKAMEEMGCFVGIDCPDDPTDPVDPVDPEPIIPANTLYVNGQPLVDSQGNYIVGE